MDELLSVADVARILAISERTVLSFLRNGDLQGFKIGGKLWRIDQSKLEDYIVKCKLA